ncbi:peptidyl-tRNA hydrolase [Candidatus Saccharibacteria bacterium RAAC3_TM7_1]|nr:peptidyl-tRNA hydrolase [Candidatus Saccharibacteria bacterium RAAC3_TM7_1]HCZ28366.1 aminoacyl-tRNA hydrolase [Candidatus Saccharibacteria bacterium]
MKLIFAQGNPGLEYYYTRHNVGFLCLDAFAEERGATYSSKPKFLAVVAETSINGEKVILAKPTTFYNESGRSARALMDFYKLDPATDILVLHDELALPFGTLRIRDRGSDAGNNGIKSLNAHLGENYHRLRIGIASEQRSQIADVDFVLARLSQDEMLLLTKTIQPQVNQIIQDFILGQHVITSHSLL